MKQIDSFCKFLFQFFCQIFDVTIYRICFLVVKYLYYGSLNIKESNVHVYFLVYCTLHELYIAIICVCILFSFQQIYILWMYMQYINCLSTS